MSISRPVHTEFQRSALVLHDRSAAEAEVRHRGSCADFFDHVKKRSHHRFVLSPIDFQKREHKSPEFLKINPAGKLPALVDGDSRIFEGAAICLYLGDKFPQAKLAPQIGAPERGRYLSLMVYSTSQLEPAMGDALLKAQHLPQRGWTNFETAKDVIEGELGDGPHLFGDWFTAADVMIGSMFIWKRIWGGPPDRPKLEAYVDRLLQRPTAMKMSG